MWCDTNLLFRYKNESLSLLWIAIENAYPPASHKASKMLVVFSTTYMRNRFQH